MSKATNIAAVLIEGESKYERAREIPGAFFYYLKFEGDEVSGIINSCPCGCGALGSLNLDPKEKAESGRPLWTNSGTREKPTLSPSVGAKAHAPGQDKESDGYHWHGYLRDGVWVSC